MISSVDKGLFFCYNNKAECDTWKNMKRVCWNWQTGTFEGRVLRRTGSSPVTRTTSSNRRKHYKWTGGWAGLRRTTGTRVYVNSVSRVRIPPCPPEWKAVSSFWNCFFVFRKLQSAQNSTKTVQKICSPPFCVHEKNLDTAKWVYYKYLSDEI